MLMMMMMMMMMMMVKLMLMLMLMKILWELLLLLLPSRRCPPSLSASKSVAPFFVASARFANFTKH
jgi:hypothetical protein